MPISTTYEIPRLNMTFTSDALLRIEVNNEYDDVYLDFGTRPIVTRRELIFHFNDGSTFNLRGNEYRIHTKVELVEGRMYQLGRDRKKWLALCRTDNITGELTLFPTTRFDPLVRESERMNYQFYKEFEHDYKEYL